MTLPEWQKPFIKESSIPLPDGGDTHIHPFGPNYDDHTITTRVPIGDGSSISIHDKPTPNGYQNEY